MLRTGRPISWWSYQPSFRALVPSCERAVGERKPDGGEGDDGQGSDPGARIAGTGASFRSNGGKLPRTSFRVNFWIADDSGPILRVRRLAIVVLPWCMISADCRACCNFGTRRTPMAVFEWHPTTGLL